MNLPALCRRADRSKRYDESSSVVCRASDCGRNKASASADVSTILIITQISVLPSSKIQAHLR